MQKTEIAWTDYSSNPLQYRDKDGNVVWACVHKSQGCFKCYSETLAKRYGRGGKFDVATMADLTPFLDEKEAHKILTYKPVSGKMCFLGDMTDIFGEWVFDRLIDRIFAVMALRPDVTFQILTKRPDRMRDYFRPVGQVLRSDFIRAQMFMIRDTHDSTKLPPLEMPLRNCWLGVSVENQEWADKRIPLLLKTPAAKRFVSYEPALEYVDFRYYLDGHEEHGVVFGRPVGTCVSYTPPLDWLVVGGESGHGARPFNIQWARDVVRHCQSEEVAVFVKQFGAYVCWDGIQGGYGDGPSNVWPSPFHNEHDGHLWRVHLSDRKGGTMSEWPEDLRVREFPGHTK